MNFQFPVGMSNRSYWDSYRKLPSSPLTSFNSPWECRIGLTVKAAGKAVEAELLPFNSPWECRIGLTSNPVPQVVRDLTFNSPWECRIGLTGIEDFESDIADLLFQFPVGMSNRSYPFGSAYANAPYELTFQFPVGMSNRSY